MVECFIMTLLQIYHWVCQWKNFENRSTFGEVTDKSIVGCFFWLTVYVSTLPHYLIAYCSAFRWTGTDSHSMFFLKLFSCLLKNSFNGLLTENLLHFHRFFIKSLSSNSIWVILTCKLWSKLSWYAMCQVMTSSSY